MTWDVDSADQPSANRLRQFVYGNVARSRGRVYRYPGFVEKEGVRYLGQSVLFVRPQLLSELIAFLERNAIDHEVTPATMG